MWLVKLAGVFAIAAVSVGAIEQSKGDWVLATDVQKYYRCLPFDWYVVTPVSADHVAMTGELVQFKPPASATRFTDQFEVIKLVAAVAGDRWVIEHDQLYLNGELWGELHLMSSLGAPAGSLDGEGVIAEGHVFVLGTNPSSYDSRYWGPLPTENITGYAHVVL